MVRLQYILPITFLALYYIPIIQAIVAGVDFGGEFFKIALVKPGTPFEIVTNVHSKRKTETIVAFDGAERLYGADAATVSVRKPQTAYSQVRRFLGTDMNHPEVIGLLQEEYFPYELLHNTTRGSISLKHQTTGQYFHAEELVAMVFTHAREITDSFAQASAKDWVITVPNFFSQAQRQALLDAAEIAGIKVLSLIDENTAAALQLAVHSTFDEKKPKRVLFYNMGSTSTQVSVVEFSSQTVPDGFKKNKTVSTFEVIAKAWDDTLGGAKFDLRLADALAKEFSIKLGEDVRKIPKPMAKLRAAAKKTKTVLSAINDRTPVSLQSLYKDMDFMTDVSRADFEALCEDLFARTVDPVEKALAQANLGVNDIDEVEIIGGAVRMPKVQKLLKTYFQEKDLGVHLNGDEAMALGAAFRAANISNSFRVRHVGMTDIASYAVGVRLVDIEPNETEEKPWVKRTPLFIERAKLGTKKAVTFSHTKDISATFRYDKPSALPKGINTYIGTVNITGIESFTKAMEEKNLGEPKVTISFELDESGIVKITKAEASLEEEVEVEVVIEKKKKEKKKTNDKKQEAGDKKEEDKEEKEDKQNEEEVKEDEKTEENEEKPETRMEKRKKTHKVALTVVEGREVHDPSVEMSILPMNVAIKKDSIAMLREMEAEDQRRKKTLEAKNRLEAYVYDAKDQLEMNMDEIELVTIPTQIEALTKQLEETEEWLYEDGDKAQAGEYIKRVKNLETEMNAIQFRISERTAFPNAVELAKEYGQATKALMEVWETEKPQVTEQERSDVIEKIDEMLTFVSESEEKVKHAPHHEKPVVTSADIDKQMQNVKKFVRILSKRPKPEPEKKEEPVKDENTTQETEKKEEVKDTNVEDTKEDTEVQETVETKSEEKDEL